MGGTGDGAGSGPGSRSGQKLKVSAPAVSALAASALASVALSWRTYYLRQPPVIRDGFWLAPAPDASCCPIRRGVLRDVACLPVVGACGRGLPVGRQALDRVDDVDTPVFDVLPDVTRVLGADHPDTYRTEDNLVRWSRLATDSGL